MEGYQMITVDEFMTVNPYTLHETDSLHDARKVMTERHIRHLPVTDKDKCLCGLVTQRDVLAATAPESILQVRSSPQEADCDIKLSEIMIRDVSTIHKTDSLRRAALFLQSHKFGCLPVLEENRVVGIITDSDFLDIAINLLEQVEISEDAGIDAMTADIVQLEEAVLQR